jgi:CRISPR/Cas system-associated exonuclease Cas4 (RecB family)
MKTIRASEIGEYVYCARAWWLRRVEGLEPAGQERRERGTYLHARHGQHLRLSSQLLTVALLLFLGALLSWVLSMF